MGIGHFAYDSRYMARQNSLTTPFLVISLIGVVLLLGRLLFPYATPIGWACVLAAVFHPAYRALLRLSPSRPGLWAALMTLVVFALAVVPALLLTGVVAREAISAYQQAAEFVASHRVEYLDRLSHHWLVAPVWNWAQERLAGRDVDPASFALSGLRWLSEFAAANAAQVARNVLGFLVGVGVLAFTLFFAFRDGAYLVAYLEESLPMAIDDRRRLFDRLQTTLLAVVQGLAATALVQAVLVGAALWVAGIPFALLLSVATFLLAFLPAGGAAFVWIPVVVGLFVSGDFLRAVALLVWGGAVVSSVDNVLRPWLIGEQAKLPTPLLFFGILGGLEAFGFLGLFAGPAGVAAFLSIVSIYRERLLALPRGEASPAAGGGDSDE